MARDTITNTPPPFLAPPEPAEDEREEESGGRRMDPELKAMAAILRILDTIAEPARGRAVRWMSDRYSHPGD